MHENAWPGGDSEMAALVRRFDWSTTPLGPIAHWPQRLRILVDALLTSPVAGALAWGAEGTLIYNAAYATVCGARHPHLLGLPLPDAWPEARDFNSAVLAAGLAGRQQVFHDAHFQLQRGGAVQDCWFDLYYAPVSGDDGGVGGVQATVLETSQRVLADRAREAGEDQLRRLNRELDEQRARLEAANRRLAGDTALLSEMFGRSPSFMAVVLGPEHRFELTNDSYDRLIQYRDVIGKPVAEALPEVADQGFVALLDRVYASGEGFRGDKTQVMLERADGTGERLERRILDFVYQPLKDERGRTYGVFIEGVDVTSSAEAEERLRVAQEAGGIGTFEWYPELGELAVSDSYRRVYGIAPGVRVDNALMLGLVDPGHRTQSGVQRFGRMANPLEYAEYPIARPSDGARRWIARRGELVDGDAGQGPRYLGVAYDITDRKNAEQALRELNDSLERRVSSELAERAKAEDALRQAQKMEAVGQLASGVAHDFNNVLQIISSNMQLMELDPQAQAPLRARLATALAAVARGSQLSGQLLAFARRQPLQPVALHLGALLRNIEPLLRRALGDAVALAIDVEPGLWHAAVDPNQLENALLNMAINARDAMEGGGEVAVTLRNGARGQVALAVRDSGCGMAPEVQARVFEPFYTTKEPGKGTGLGMSMVYGFVKQSGGEIRIDSAPGAGTTITIELPRADAAPAVPAPAPPAVIAGGSETILVAEDDPAVRAAALDMLHGLGYRVLAAASGAEALAILDGGAQVDLVFSDVSMPGRVDSTALVLRCRGAVPPVAVLLTSGHAVERALLDPRLPDGIDLLPKPYGLAQLAQALRRQLGAPRERAADAAPGGGERSFVVIDDDGDTRELVCELLKALGHRARGAAGAEAALELLRGGGFDTLFTDLHMPGIAGDELAARAAALVPGLDVIISTGDGRFVPAPGVVLLPKPWDLLQLQDAIGALGAAARPPA